jgi:hypothetical protein
MKIQTKFSLHRLQSFLQISHFQQLLCFAKNTSNLGEKGALKLGASFSLASSFFRFTTQTVRVLSISC